ncbi:MAG TPA: acylphosphatase [Flavobacteriales bacterium]|nr:acylphosphatase [Flavobacteriales bacterium]
MERHYKISIEGKVQGVYFRTSARDKAEELGVFGFIENKPDSVVYIEAEGIESKLLAFMEWCHIGPDDAEVDKIQVEEDSVKGFKEFVIR